MTPQNSLLNPMSGDLYAPRWAGIYRALPGFCDVDFDYPMGNSGDFFATVTLGPQGSGTEFSLKNPVAIDTDADYLAREIYVAPIAGSTVGVSLAINPQDLKIRIRDADGNAITSDWITANDLCGPLGPVALPLRAGGLVTVDLWNQGDATLVVQMGFKGWKRFPCADQQSEIPRFIPQAERFCKEWAGVRFEEYEYFFEFSNGVNAFTAPWVRNLQPSTPGKIFAHIPLPMDNDADFLWRGITGMIMRNGSPVAQVPQQLFLRFYDLEQIPLSNVVPNTALGPQCPPGAELVISDGGGRMTPHWPEILLPRGSTPTVDIGLSVVECTHSSYTDKQTLLPQTDSFQGFTTAAKGNTLVVGSPGSAGQTGTVQVYSLSGGVWSLQQVITPGDGVPNQDFGTSVSFDGTTIAVGSTGDGIPANGAVYLYRLVGGVWTQFQEIPSPSGAVAGGTDSFGNAVQILGNVLLIGAPLGDNTGAVQTGIVYYYLNSGTGYTLVQTFTGADSVAADGFGLNLSAFGNWLFVGTDQNSAAAGTYVFELTGGAYVQTQKLAAGQPSNGLNLCVASNQTAYVGIVNAGGLGSVNVYQNLGGPWELLTTLQSGSASDLFGTSVVGTDTDVFIGAPKNDAGDVYWFENQEGSWNQLQEITVGSPVSFGQAVSITGQWLLVGDPSSNAGGGNGGAVFAFLLGCSEDPSGLSVQFSLRGLKVYNLADCAI